MVVHQLFNVQRKFNSCEKITRVFSFLPLTYWVPILYNNFTNNLEGWLIYILTNEEILKLSPVELLFELEKEYIKKIPCSIETSEDLKAAGKMLCELTNSYSYLMSLNTLADMQLRNAKARKEDKEMIADMTSRRDAIKNAVEIIKFQYAGLSRAITVRKQVDEEMKMA